MALARSAFPSLGAGSQFGSIARWQRTFMQLKRICLAAPLQQSSSAFLVKCSNSRSSSSSSISSSISSISSSNSSNSSRRSSSYVPEKQLKISAPVLLEESLDSWSNLQLLKDVVTQLEQDAPRAVQLVVGDYKAAQLADETELSVTICDDGYIRKLNKEWLGKDVPTDVLSFPQDQLPGEAPLLLLGDVVISVDTAAQQAEERNHSLLDEMRILLVRSALLVRRLAGPFVSFQVHGLLHLLGYDHELGAEAKRKMEEKEQEVLKGLGWKGKGLISASSFTTGSDELPVSSKSGSAARKTRSPFKFLFCDMDGTLLNSQSRITNKTANALKAAIEAGVQVILATGKTRQAAIAALENVGLVGENGVVSASSPGVFIQGLLVYGTGGAVVHKALLPEDYCLQAFRYALEHRIPTVGFSMDTTVAPFEHPFVHVLHERYFEPEAEILTCLEELPKYQIQKLLFNADQDTIEKVIKPQLATLIQGPVTFTQAQEGMLEMLPDGCTKGSGVKKLLEHLQVDPDQVMAVGDGENDIEMLDMVGWGVAMANGAPRTLQIADVTVSSNDMDGVAEAVERFILP